MEQLCHEKAQFIIIWDFIEYKNAFSAVRVLLNFKIYVEIFSTSAQTKEFSSWKLYDFSDVEKIEQIVLLFKDSNGYKGIEWKVIYGFRST